MSNYKYQGIELTPAVFKDLLIQFFDGKQFSRQEAVDEIQKYHLENGGLLTKATYLATFKKAAQQLKDAGIDIIGKKMTIVGAGGAATAIQVQAALDGVKEISIFNRKDEFYERAQKTVKDINEKTNCKATLYDLEDLDKLKEEIASSYIFTNATGMGMKPLEGQTYIPDKSFLREDLIVTDVVYAPAETALLKMAKEVGCKTLNGFPMMLFQGAAAFKLWTNQDMPIEHVKEVMGIQY